MIILLLALLVWYWYDGTQVKEMAMKAARRACERHGQQLLDETVVLARIRPRRDRSGRVRWWRFYRFEFTADGEHRSAGEVHLLGQRVTNLSLAMDEHTLYDEDKEDDAPRFH